MKRVLRWLGIAGLSLVGLAVVAYGLVFVASERVLKRAYPRPPAAALTLPADDESIAEGRRLATVHGCFGDCHGAQAQGAVMFDKPMVARIVAPSLIAAARKYSPAELEAIIRHGIRPNGRSVIVMPSETMAVLTDADLTLILAFLRSLPESAAAVGDALSAGVTPGPLGRIGLATGEFKTAVQLLGEHVAPPEAHDAVSMKGRYLAMTVCAHCHGRDLRGNTTPAFTAPSLRIVDAYSTDALKELLRTGTAIGGRTLGFMTATAKANLSSLTDEEIAAIDTYLRGAQL